MQSPCRQFNSRCRATIPYERSSISSTASLFIASEYLAQLKAESGFADVPPEKMTREQMQELAARYNGGPYYDSDDAKAYGRGFDRRLDQAKEALG